MDKYSCAFKNSVFIWDFGLGSHGSCEKRLKKMCLNILLAVTAFFV